jgi:excisionase family DNA binding protein
MYIKVILYSQKDYGREVDSVKTYNVKQIADMLNTQPETVRRWIRSGKLYAEKASRKEGNVVKESDLNKFLKSSPKYASLAGGLVGAAVMMPVAAVPVVGGIAASYLAASKKAKETGDESFSKEDVTRYLQAEIERRNQSINQKLSTIEQLQREITNDQQQITECNFVLGQLENEEE